MSVARETIVAALKRLVEVEEFAIQNLVEVSRFDFRRFAPRDRKRIRLLLRNLGKNSDRHEKRIQKIIARLTHET